ncbi:PLP-dependent aminotransferase family protein [Paenibacillus caui]|uniref:MocR-like pyridoxine biosynthesis transcription factor PdxR n=1 Tax=Paenibacillus caui TaxID=2873927 RepID=UPI001CA8E342|nr:PLP-dependent aminotransferase family protein [Paenibacillus caui]
MHIQLDRKLDKTLSDQIADSLESRIESGLIRPGEKLASVRELASGLAVSLVTVSKAYTRLEKQGLIHCSQGKGCYVSDKASQSVAGETQESRSWQLAVVDYLPRAQLWRHYNGSRARYQFHKATIQPELLPTEEISNNLARSLLKSPQALTDYGPFQGDPQLRQTLAEHLKKRKITHHPDQILITSGSQQAIDLIARTFVGPGDTVYMEAPTYTGAIDVFINRGAKIIGVPMDQEGMRIDLLTKLCDTHPPKIIYTIPTFHNPTGVVMSAVRRRQLLELAQSYSCLIVEDDPLSDIFFGVEPPAPIKSMDSAGHVIYIKSFSKLLSPGCRTACVVTDGSILSRLVAAKTTTDLGSPLVIQHALQPLIESRKFDSYLLRLRKVLASRCQTALKLLSEHAPAEIQWTIPEGGLNIWITLPAQYNTSELFILGQRESVCFLPGSVCYPAEAEHHHIRISFSMMEDQLLHEGMLHLCRLFRLFISENNKADQRPTM